MATLKVYSREYGIKKIEEKYLVSIKQQEEEEIESVVLKIKVPRYRGKI